MSTLGIGRFYQVVLTNLKQETWLSPMLLTWTRRLALVECSNLMGMDVCIQLQLYHSSIEMLVVMLIQCSMEQSTRTPISI